MFDSVLPPVVCGRAHAWFTLCVLVSVQWCPKHIVFWLYFVYDLCLVYLLLPVSLNCPFLIAPSIFSNVYIYTVKPALVTTSVSRNESGRFGVLKSDSTHHFFRNACTKSGSLLFSQFSGCWLIVSVYIIMSFDFPFVRLLGVR